MPSNNAAVILELWITLCVSLEVSSFLFNCVCSQDLKATLHQSVNISTGRFQATSSCASNTGIENVETARGARAIEGQLSSPWSAWGKAVLSRD